MPHLRPSVEELSLTASETADRGTVSVDVYVEVLISLFQSTAASIMAMTKTRRKQKQELLRKAMQEAEKKQSEQREQFVLRSTPALLQAAYEPALFHSTPLVQQAAGNEEGRSVLLLLSQQHLQTKKWRIQQPPLHVIKCQWHNRYSLHASSQLPHN